MKKTFPWPLSVLGGGGPKEVVHGRGGGVKYRGGGVLICQTYIFLKSWICHSYNISV